MKKSIILAVILTVSFKNFSYPSILLTRRVKNLSLLTSNFEEIYPVFTQDKREINIGIKHFPDGEIYVQILNPNEIVGKSISFSHTLNSAEDYMQILLISSTLKQYRAKEVSLTLNNWEPFSEEDNYLLRILRIFCDEIKISPQGNGNIQTLSILEPEEYGKETYSGEEKGIHIDKVAYINERFDADAHEAVKRIKDASSSSIEVSQVLPGHWQVNIPSELQDKNVVLIHSTEDSENFLKLFLTLFALREEGVRSISLINTYQGYARQHKEREDAVGEGISVITVLKVINNFLDNNLLDNKKNDIVIDFHPSEREGITSLEPEIFIFKDGKKIVINKLEPEEIFNLCGFIQLSEYLIESIPSEEITEEHPLLLIAPDDGSYFYVEKTAEVLRKRYGLNVVAGFLYKKRKTAEEVTITKPGIYKKDEDGNNVLLSFSELNKHWIIDLDDVISTGGTMLSSIYHLVRILGADWRKIYVGVDHWKVPVGSKVFDTGLSEEELKTAKLPKNIDDDNKRMPPIRIITMATLPLPQGIESVSLAVLIAHAIKRILGKKAEALFVGNN